MSVLVLRICFAFSSLYDVLLLALLVVVMFPETLSLSPAKFTLAPSPLLHLSPSLVSFMMSQPGVRGSAPILVPPAVRTLPTSMAGVQ
ncbi:hypothetical protein BIW11_02547 [Tropilaelaps mercedesae]|uniref:Uncharacterized protein n=1 Tax=Tropilaelaps mercedesae TaxID=418985 RepID=A0A1V9Y1D9_9ACAR|nr:hypothetical protein BIW11_02547 [Tropilaelaps mercedesae]